MSSQKTQWQIILLVSGILLVTFSILNMKLIIWVMRGVKRIFWKILYGNTHWILEKDDPGSVVLSYFYLQMVEVNVALFEITQTKQNVSWIFRPL